MIMINNPILEGFCPDPSIVRVGNDYYIAVSTFEWWPGGKNISFKRSTKLDAVRSSIDPDKSVEYVRRSHVRWSMGTMFEL